MIIFELWGLRFFIVGVYVLYSFIFREIKVVVFDVWVEVLIFGFSLEVMG